MTSLGDFLKDEWPRLPFQQAEGFDAYLDPPDHLSFVGIRAAKDIGPIEKGAELFLQVDRLSGKCYIFKNPDSGELMMVVDIWLLQHMGDQFTPDRFTVSSERKRLSSMRGTYDWEFRFKAYWLAESKKL